LLFSQLVLIALVWLGLMFHGMWPSATATCLPTPAPTPPVPKRTREHPPFAGRTTKPLDACAHTSAPCPHAPPAPPLRLVMARGRYREIDDSATQVHVLPALCSAHLAIRSVLSVRTYTDSMGEASVLHERVSLVDMGGHGEASRTLRALDQISAAPCRRAVAL